ncbi:hypothetical protein [Companilactobacillus baiquanensis]|uniref:Surface layer protein A domain-containing protein n=1 Tax=Companilactobacillus baiquanensis TaxID=2486005 RepID=A0ABW1UUA6_9LACO|nr:hypothetical protein [Companilactobacillus baiquanensis]
MKKSMKYASILFSASLLLAPIFAPGLNYINVVEASDTDTGIDTERLQSIADEIKSNIGQPTFKNFGVSYTSLPVFFDSGFDTAKENGFPGSVFMQYYHANGLGFVDTGVFDDNDYLSSEDAKYLQDNNIYFQMIFYDANNKKITDAGYYISQDAVTMDLNMKYKVDGQSYSGNIPILEKSKMTYLDLDLESAKLQYPKEVTVKTGTTENDIQNIKYMNTKLIDTTSGSNMAIVGGTKEASSDGLLFGNKSDAIANLNSDTTAGVVDAGDPLEDGIYYRVVSAYLTLSAVNYMVIASYGDVDIDVGAEPDEYILPEYDDAPFKFVQKITVKTPSNNNGGNSDVLNGIVTTHTDKDSYSLYNDDNQKVDNRALAANSSWQVDKIRTINGIKQYRVSTHEWVNASDVDFIDGGQVTEGMTVTNLDIPKKVDLSSTHNIYNLHNSNKEVSTTRALAGGTSWLVDKIGTDMHGGIYYGVSSNEFVKADDGVNLVK